jgi:hypothetical protein
MRLPPVFDGRDISGAGDAGRRSERVRQRKGRLKVCARKEMKALAIRLLNDGFGTTRSKNQAVLRYQ